MEYIKFIKKIGINNLEKYLNERIIKVPFNFFLFNIYQIINHLICTELENKSTNIFSKKNKYNFSFISNHMS